MNGKVRELTVIIGIPKFAIYCISGKTLMVRKLLGSRQCSENVSIEYLVIFSGERRSITLHRTQKNSPNTDLEWEKRAQTKYIQFHIPTRSGTLSIEMRVSIIMKRFSMTKWFFYVNDPKRSLTNG